MSARRLLPHIDWLLIAAVGMLSVMGLVMIFSATYEPTEEQIGQQFFRQIGTLLLGIVALGFCLIADYRVFSDYAWIVYLCLTTLLIYTLIFGIEQGGAQRWIGLGSINLQPSEFSRIAVAIALASFYGQERRGLVSLTDLVLGGLLVVVPFALIAWEPDLGTAVTLVPVCITIMVFAGLKLRVLALVSLLGIIAVPIVWAYGMEDYQKTRIESFLDPEQDPQGVGYQQIQARITVGSGGLTGRGFLQGTQSQYNFLPVAHNDFIFSVLAEEYGFLGVLFTLGLYLFVILRSLDAARLAKDRIGTYLVVGITAGFAFQVIYNVTMSAGLAPVKGLTLPLMSYGGSSLVATLIGFGLILNVRMRRFEN